MRLSFWKAFGLRCVLRPFLFYYSCICSSEIACRPLRRRFPFPCWPRKDSSAAVLRWDPSDLPFKIDHIRMAKGARQQSHLNMLSAFPNHLWRHFHAIPTKTWLNLMAMDFISALPHFYLFIPRFFLLWWPNVNRPSGGKGTIFGDVFSTLHFICFIRSGIEVRRKAFPNIPFDSPGEPTKRNPLA